jgi:hypothetical protein
LPPIANKQHCSTHSAAPSQTVDPRTTARHFWQPHVTPREVVL